MRPILLLLLAGSTAHARGIRYESIDAGDFRAHVFRVDLGATTLEVRAAEGAPRRVIREIVPGDGELVAVNGSYFDTRDRAMGIVAGRGRPIPRWSTLVVTGGKARLVEGRHLLPADRPAALVQGSPRLLVDGVIQRLKPQVARRTAVCAEGSLLVLVVTSRADATELAQFLRDRLSCTNALNLDGGASTQLEARLPGVQLSEPGQAVPNALVIH